WLPVEKLADQQLRPAQQVHPLRMAVIAASFPYREQLKEFQKKLNLPTLPEVLADVSGEVDPNTGAVQPAFRFLGVNLQRVQVDADGKPLKVTDKGDVAWETIDINRAYRPLVYHNGKRFEPDPPDIDAMSVYSYGLMMPKLALVNGHKEQY